MSIETLEDALADEMRDMLHAEKQMTRALRKMIRKASSEELKTAFEEHLEETERQVERLEQAFETCGLKPRGKRCEGMAGIIEEGQEIMQEAADSEVLDPLLIAAAQKAEHYEIASYGTLCAWAEMLGHHEALELLQENLNEEKQTDERLTSIALELNRQAQEAAQEG